MVGRQRIENEQTWRVTGYNRLYKLAMIYSRIGSVANQGGLFDANPNQSDCQIISVTFFYI
jgi:hypothetical protein